MTRGTANLTCYKVACGGEFTPVSDDTTKALYRCQSCGAELSQTATEALAEKDSAVGQLANRLLENVKVVEQ